MEEVDSKNNDEIDALTNDAVRAYFEPTV